MSEILNAQKKQVWGFVPSDQWIQEQANEQRYGPAWREVMHALANPGLVVEMPPFVTELNDNFYGVDGKRHNLPHNMLSGSRLITNRQNPRFGMVIRSIFVDPLTDKLWKRALGILRDGHRPDFEDDD
jgi:hypothetical protein